MTLGTTLDERGLFVDRPTAITTYSGRVIDPIDPDPADICIEDVAHHLSNLCRFTGATERFYSVAEHSVRVASLVDPEYKLEALLHDASEAYVADIAKPVKESEEFSGYRDVEFHLEKAVRLAFGLPLSLPLVHWPKQIKEADHRMFQVEAKILCPRGVGRFVGDITYSYREYPTGWSPNMAKSCFIDAFNDYSRKVQS